MRLLHDSSCLQEIFVVYIQLLYISFILTSQLITLHFILAKFLKIIRKAWRSWKLYSVSTNLICTVEHCQCLALVAVFLTVLIKELIGITEWSNLVTSQFMAFSQRLARVLVLLLYRPQLFVFYMGHFTNSKEVATRQFYKNATLLNYCAKYLGH
jgi:hypothetical protein